MNFRLSILLVTFTMAMAELARALTAETLVPQGAIWKYNASGTSLGTVWSAPGYDDTIWSSGPAPLGYGDGDESTPIPYGPDANNKYPCYYFRHAFTVTDPSAISSLILQVLADDGCVVYLNGTEVARDNMPAGTVSYATYAASAIEATTYHSFTVSPALVVAAPAVNALAVEVHQATGSSTDVAFDLSLAGNVAGAVAITKGPYLQQVTANGVVVMWESDQAVAGRVDYGFVAPNEAAVIESAPTTLHEVALNGLAAKTFYQYKVTSGSATSSINRFITASDTVDHPFRFAVYGDTRTYPADHRAVVQAMILNDPAFVLHVGDFATSGRTYSEWAPQFFEPAADLIKSVPLFPALGNHEYSGTGPLWYLDFFSVPDNGSSQNAGHWYAFTYGSVRFMGLNACEGGDAFTPGSEQYNWLWNELTSPEFTAARWQIVFDHNPPYTAVERDNGVNVNLRTHLVPLFEQYGVDVVFSGDDHHYRHSVRNGIHYIVTGGGGAPLRDLGTAMSGATLIHAEKTFEHCIVDISPTTLSFYASRNDRSVLESFVISQNGPPSQPSGLTAVPGDAQVSLSWDPVSGATGYNVKRATTSDGPYTTIGSTTSSGYVDSVLVNGTTFFYVVSATNSADESANSTEVAVTPSCPAPAAPTNLQAKAGNAQVALAWAASAGAATYEVKRATEPGGTYSSIATGLTSSAYTDILVANGTTYSYVVGARSPCGVNSDSAPVSATPQTPPPPTAATLAYFRAMTAGQGRVTLSWGTLVEVQTLGFHVDRSTPGGGWQRVTTGILPAAGSDQRPHNYGLKDTSWAALNGLRYRLVEVDLSGHKTVIAEAVVRSAVAAQVSRSASGLKVAFRGQPSTVIAVETAAMVAGPWTPQKEVKLDGEGAASVTLGITGSEPTRFYRWEQD